MLLNAGKAFSMIAGMKPSALAIVTWGGGGGGGGGGGAECKEIPRTHQAKAIFMVILLCKNCMKSQRNRLVCAFHTPGQCERKNSVCCKLQNGSKT